MPTDPNKVKWIAAALDDSGSGTAITPTSARRITIAGWRDEDILAAQPQVTPAPGPVPYKIIQPNTRPAGSPATISGPQKIAGVWYKGWSTNMVVDGPQAVSFEDGITSEAFPDPGKSTEGQGCYVYRQTPVTFKSWLFYRNGWAPGAGASSKTMFSHGLYVGDLAGPSTVEDSIFADNCYSGAQPRANATATYRRCVFVGNSVNFLPVAGDVTLEDCLLIGGSYSSQGQVWTGNVSLSAWTNVTCKNVTIVGMLGQDNPPVPNGWKKNPPVALWADAGHDHNPTGKGKVSGTITIARFPWTQTMERSGGSIDKSGLKFIPGNPVQYDYRAVLADVMARKMTAADASAKIRNDVGKLIA